MTYALRGGLEPSTAVQTVTTALPASASRSARVRGSPGPLLANPLAQSVRDHRSGASPSRQRRARSTPAGAARPAGARPSITCRLSTCAFLTADLVSCLLAFRMTPGLPGGAELGAVALAKSVLLAFADARIRVDVRSVLNLVLGHGKHDQLLTVEPGSADRREALPGPEQAGLHEDPFRLPGLVVEVHLGARLALIDDVTRLSAW